MMITTLSLLVESRFWYNKQAVCKCWLLIYNVWHPRGMGALLRCVTTLITDS